MSEPTLTELERRLDAAMTSLGEHAECVMIFVISEELGGTEVLAQGAGLKLAIRQAVRDWLVVQDREALQIVTEAMAESDDDDEQPPAGHPA